MNGDLGIINGFINLNEDDLKAHSHEELKKVM